MRFVSFCSGIGSAELAWAGLDWQCVAQAEIDKAACAVLQARFPGTPNLGDVSKITEADLAALGHIDLIVGGTPCQSFSVAGLRGGLNDARGNLTLEFLKLVQRIRPKWVVWENVPGILSDETKALDCFLDGLEELRYVVDIDILDAQFFGLAQRRRRVIVCAQSIEDLMQEKTTSSALTVSQCLVESLVLVLAVARTQCRHALDESGFDATNPESSLQKRMRLFGLDLGPEPALMLVGKLAVMRGWFGSELGASGLASGRSRSRSSVDTRSHELNAATEPWRAEYLNTATSWSGILVDALRTMNACITSTSKSAITESQIYSCARTAMLIAAHITQSMDSSPAFWSAAQSCLTALKGFIAYARSASSDLFTSAEWLRPWGDFLQQAERAADTLGNLGVESFGEVLPISQSLLGNPAPRRETGQSVTGTLSARTEGGGGLGTDFEIGGGVIVDDVAKCLSAARGAACAHDTSLETYVAQAYGGNNTQGEIDVSTALRAKGGTGHGDFESETFVAQPIPFDTTQITHPEKGGHAPTIAFTCKDYGGDARADGITPTLRAMNETDGNANAGGQIAIAFNARQDPIHTDDLGLPLDTDGTTQAVAFKPSFYTRDHAGGSPEDISQPLLAHDGGPGDTDPVVFEARFARKGRGAPEDVCPPLKAQSGETGKGDAAPLLATAWAVRRLTPTECHRLQGMPDNWCRVEYRGSEMKDGPMYKMLGNAMARNVMEWIGHQIARCVNEDVAL